MSVAIHIEPRKWPDVNLEFTHESGIGQFGLDLQLVNLR